MTLTSLDEYFSATVMNCMSLARKFASLSSASLRFLRCGRIFNYCFIINFKKILVSLPVKAFEKLG